MLTTCPECHTTFRISQAQLDCRRGLVRCGRCSAVFNAYDTLLPELKTLAQADAAASSPTESRFGPGEPFQAGSTELNAAKSPATPHTPTVERTGEQAKVQPAEPQAGNSAQTASDAGAILSPPGDEAPESILLAELPLQRPTNRLSKLLWGVASAVLAVAFGLQLAYFLRAEIVHAWPQSRPLLTQACARLGCDLPLPQDLTAVRIDAASLETDPEDSARTVLSLSLSNRGAQTVAWPHLVLTLTDTRDAPIAQRPFSPAEYLDGESAVARGLAPGLEREIRLELELDGLPAYGYKLDKRYP